eukprot:3937782-Rhodomonas_salina.3
MVGSPPFHRLESPCALAARVSKRRVPVLFCERKGVLSAQVTGLDDRRARHVSGAQCDEETRASSAQRPLW